MTDAQRPDLTTHAEWGAGRPHLLVTSDQEHRFVHHLVDEETRIGSGPDCQVRLAGLQPVHAIIRHDRHDDYDLSMLGPGETSANLEKAAEEERRDVEALHTGARFTAGPWRFVFVRDEYADHGRPFGGREGGEFSDQPVQDPRPEYEPEGEEGAAEGRQRGATVEDGAAPPRPESGA
ncbi:FHA domain-containing protein [Microbacterium sp. 22242]|uniref:FHA domain-containing protein n=1 Tax=Microbacterium sp. 22242 TaxID=3453896 RepID=UPI003F842DDC